MATANKIKNRYPVVDWLRGLAVLAMIAYHTIWDLVYIHGISWSWFASDTAFVCQRAIRWSFLLLSGFCWAMGKKQWKRGLVVLGCSLVITLVSLMFMQDDPIHFGVLTFLGSAMLLTIPANWILKKINPYLGMGICLLLFVLLVNAELGQIQFFSYKLLELPQWLYANYATAYLGFPQPGFYSSDYVPLIPWIFVYWIGYFGYGIFVKNRWQKALRLFRIPPLEWVGRHALVIYMAHQPIIYAVLFIVFEIIRM